MKRFILFLLLFFFILGLEGRACAECGESITVNAVDHQRLKSKAHEAKAYCVSKGFSTNYCFLVDFSIHSGKKRFFVWDFKGDSIKYASLCAHGYGKPDQGSTRSGSRWCCVPALPCALPLSHLQYFVYGVHQCLHLLRRADGDAQPVFNARRIKMPHQNAVFL